MKGKILVFKGQSRYNVLRIAADYMVDAFYKKGYQVHLVDLTLEEERQRIMEILGEEYDLIFSFQALLFDSCLTDGKTSDLSFLANTPVFGHIVDHPIFHSTRLEPSHGTNIFLGCIDRSHVDYIKKYYPSIRNVFYLPHAGFKAKNIIPYENRTIDVFFPSSYIKPSVILDKIEKLPEVYKVIAKELIHNMLENPLLHLQDALYLYLYQIKFEYKYDEFLDLMQIFSVVDEYIRVYTRDKCIRYLLKNKINITVSGGGWREFDTNHKNYLHIISTTGLEFFDVLEFMGNSKMVLNHVPTLQNGMHERIFSSMLCGAICLTNDFPIIHEEFTDNKNIILYSNSKLQTFADKIKELLVTPYKAKEIATTGQYIAEQSHTWDRNAQEILNIVWHK